MCYLLVSPVFAKCTTGDRVLADISRVHSAKMPVIGQCDTEDGNVMAKKTLSTTLFTIIFTIFVVIGPVMVI